MYLKRLELQGFKSFQSKTPFDFGPGITAVVGPNGSGKSNVGEAVRWVLGEQQTRSLRARRLEDVIFSGSSTKAAVGMAEVSITLDNAEGWLPVDYSEVVVSRRAYRSGESEYLINKSKVRLRDVQDLFLRAQVGQNSYAFMGQGLVEEVLLMRPEERRRLLEEAADVRLLRTRLDEARDRLSATRENLARVNLLLEELAPRVRQLERQASRAAEHSHLANELAATLRDLYSHQWAAAREASSAARAVFEERQKELEAGRAEVQACEEGLETLAPALEERQREAVARRERQRALSDRVHALEQRLSLDRERVDTQTRRREEVVAELTSLRDERADQQRQLTSLRQRLINSPEIDEAKALISTRRQELNALEQEQAGLRRRIGDSQDAVERARRGMSEIQRSIARLDEEERQAQGEGARRLNQRGDLLDALTEVGAEFMDLRQRYKAVDREVAGAEHDRGRFAEMIERSRASTNALETELGALSSQVAQLHARYELLTRLQGAQEGLDGGARYLLAEGASGSPAEQQRAVEGLVGLVRDIIHVPPGLERAIEAALADNIQALVFESLPAALEAIEALEQNEAGRALIYPLDALRSVPPLNLIREKGVIGVAARLVRFDSPFHALVDALLGRTIVVENVTYGREVLRRGLGAVVTLNGVLLRPNGAISGGVSQGSSEAFARQHELDAIPDQYRRAANDRDNVGARLQREREALEEALDALAQAEPLLNALRDERAQVQNALVENRGRLILLRSQAMTLWKQLRQGELELDWAGRRERLLAEAAELEAGTARAVAALTRDRDALSVIAAKRNAVIDAVTEAAAAQADLEGETKSLGRQAEMVEAALQRAGGRLKDRESSLRQIDSEVSALLERSESARLEHETARQELAALNSELDPAEGELNHLVTRERSLREQLALARGRQLECERAFLEAEAALKLRGDEIEALRDLIAAEGYLTEGDRIVAPGGGEDEVRKSTMGGGAVDSAALRQTVAELRQRIRGLGPVNEQAQADYGENKERFDFLKGQVDDLHGSEETLLSAIEELESNIRDRLRATFDIVDKEFQRYFEAFFNGGKAQLSLTQPDDYANTGIEILAQPPGKRVNTTNLLSGGERALTSLALLLSLLEAHPSPICVLDEVDAALDETNVGRFVDALEALEQKTQFIIITHNPRTIEAADAIYGISMGADNTSRVLSVRLDDATHGETATNPQT